MYSKYPVCILGGAVQKFLSTYSGRINKVESLDEIRELISYYDGVSSLEYPVVIGDLSFLPNAKMAEALLLKFLEESKLNVILFAQQDTLSGVILSRMAVIVKEKAHDIKSSFMPPQRAHEALAELSPDTHYSNRLKVISEISPKYYYLSKIIKSDRIREKLFTIGKKQ